MFYLTKEQIIKKPIDEVFDFFSKPENLNDLTPEYLKFKILTSSKVKMHLGDVFYYRIKIGLIPFKWKTVIVNCNWQHSFTDAQFKGPYKQWIHTHLFIEMEDKTKMIDIVFYDLYGRIFKNFINKYFVKSKIEDIFNYRFQKIEKLFN